MGLSPLSAGKFWGLRRMADRAGRFKMLAVDQRPPIKSLVAERRAEASARPEDVRAVKRLLMATLGPQASAVLVDPTHALTDALTMLDPAHGLIVTLEDSLFEETPGGRRSAAIPDWSVTKIRRVGADAVKVLAWYRPDQEATTRAHQEDFVRRTGEACARHDIPFLLELLVYPLPGAADHTAGYVEQPAKRAEHVLASVERFARPEFGVDVFKLESPMPAAKVPAPVDDPAAVAECHGLFAQLGILAGRPWVMLSAGASKTAFRNVLHHAYAAGASGYLAGRALWWDAFQAFPDLDAMRAGLEGDARAYEAELDALTDKAAKPWSDWFAEAAPAGTRSSYFPTDYAEG